MDIAMGLMKCLAANCAPKVDIRRKPKSNLRHVSPHAAPRGVRHGSIAGEKDTNVRNLN
jgi:hypothetical protein